MKAKREAMEKFCSGRHCTDCPVGAKPHKCGRGCAFCIEEGNSGYITDAEVEEAYKLAFPERADGKSIKTITQWCTTCTNRKTCAIDEGFREACRHDEPSIPSLWERDKSVELKEKPTPREEILREAIKCVCTDRNQQYGEPEESFQCIADMWNAYLKPIYPEIQITKQQAAMMCALFKAARDATAKIHKKDTYVDLAGYAACAGGMIE